MCKPARFPKTKPSPKQKPALLAAFLFGTLLGYGVASYRQEVPAPTTSDKAIVQVRFSPGGHCTQWVEHIIAKAQKTILVQAYAFTSLPIANALIKAHQKGIIVKLLVDRSQRTGKYTQVPRMLAHGIPVLIDKAAGIAHNKVMILDDAYVLTGSFNWTKAAETRNAENLLLIQDATIHQAYTTTWHQRAARAQPLPAGP